jgi:hypothetical protein
MINFHPIQFQFHLIVHMIPRTIRSLIPNRHWLKRSRHIIRNHPFLSPFLHILSHTLHRPKCQFIKIKVTHFIITKTHPPLSQILIFNYQHFWHQILISHFILLLQLYYKLVFYTLYLYSVPHILLKPTILFTYNYS